MFDHWLIDMLRLLVAATALWLAALVLRLAWGNRRGWDPAKPHPATYLSFALALVLIAGVRIENIGDPPTWKLWVALVVVALGTWGVVAKIRFETRVPLRRRTKSGYRRGHEQG